MPQIGLGAVTIVTPGTHVNITKNVLPLTSATQYSTQSILIQALSNGTHTNTGRVFVYDKSGTRVATLPIPTATSVPSYSITVPGTLALDPADFSIDADYAGDGADCSILTP